MIGNRFRRTVSALRSANSSETRRRLTVHPAIESLEGRQLLSGFTGLSASRNVVVHGSVYNISVTGGGFEAVRPEGRGQFSVSLFGTTSQSTLNVSLTSFRPRLGIAPISFNSVQIRTGELGTINAGAATIDGIVTPLAGVKAFNVGSITGNARLFFASSPSTFNVGTINLASGGEIYVQGDLTAPLTVSSLTLNGGNFSIGQDAIGAMNIGSLSVENGGSFSVGRDLTGAVTIAGNLTLDSGGNLSVGRDLTSLTINGNFVVTPTGGTMSVDGNLNAMTVVGTLQGKGTNTKGPDINVGLNINSLTVQGGYPNSGGIEYADIEAGKDISNLVVPHGIFYSFMYAGVLINGGNQSGGNIGPDGADAIVNSEIRAGTTIENFVINGNVRSSFVTNPNSQGYPTRIIAGENRQGVWSNGGLIDNFQILGAMYDSVLAASVVPYGGIGSLPSYGYGPAPSYTSAGAPGYYNAPAGQIAGGTFVNPIYYPNYTQTNVFNEKVVGKAFNTGIDPNVHVSVLFGAINPSFSSAPNTSISLYTTTTSSTNTSNSGSSSTTGNSSTTTTTFQTPIPLPTKSTVVGGVFTTYVNRTPGSDYAGIYAADTRGVFVGNLPSGG